MRKHESADDVNRSCNNCGDSNWSVFEVNEYGGERDNNIEKTWFRCLNCNGEGKLYEESGNENWSGNLR